MQYKELPCQSAMNKLKRKFPYGWDLNVYRGCQHQCRYCFAMYSHKYMEENSDYFEDIFVKTNIVEALEKELRAKSWKREIVNIGGVTDSYQAAEKDYELMPAILKLMIKYKTPVIISTKSDLILRDFDLIDELSRITYVNIASTITTMDERVRKKIEPGGVPSLKRVEMLRTMRKTNASVGWHMMPIIPYLTDSDENLEAACYHANSAGVHYFLPGTLYLRGQTKKVFLNAMQTDFPHLYEPLKTLYKTGGAGKEYKDILYQRLNNFRKKYGLSGGYAQQIKEKLQSNEPKQMELF